MNWYKILQFVKIKSCFPLHFLPFGSNINYPFPGSKTDCRNKNKNVKIQRKSIKFSIQGGNEKEIRK